MISFYHYFSAYLSALFYGFPSRKLTVIGVTGTNGKSTTVLMITRILEWAGFMVGSVSSFWYKIGEHEKSNPLHMTMPGPWQLQKLLRQMVGAGCQYAVLEVTSEGIKQFRHRGINFDVAVLTNLSPEHIEAHGGFEKYRAAKMKLFAGLEYSRRKTIIGGKIAKTSVVNLDDKNADYFLRFGADKKYGFGIGNKELRTKNKGVKMIEARDIENKEDSVSFFVFDGSTSLATPSLSRGSLFLIPIIGNFNANNALAATTVAISQGINLDIAIAALKKITGIPGRMEFIQKQPFYVIVDLAHTPPAIEKVYQAVKKLLKSIDNKIITVFGAAGGGRDHWKRPELGRLAARYCDKIILTNEDPYDENPQKIVDEIFGGIFQEAQNKVEQILDRRQAIKHALKSAMPGDIVLLLGKGTEPNMVFADKKIPWDDRVVVREELGQK